MAIRPSFPSTRLPDSEPTFASRYPEFIARVAALRRHRDREWARLSQSEGRDRRGRVRSLLASDSLHLLYAYEGTRKAGQLASSSPASIRGLAERCNPFQRCDEPSTPVWARKNGRRRLVTSFGPAKRGRQTLVADVLRRIHPPLEQQCLFRGGMPAAFRAVEAAYAKGFRYGVEVDFTDFYGSVGHEGLAELLRPLPERVVDHVVWDRDRSRHDVDAMADMPVSMSWCYPALTRQRGIALGSACSPMVGERILAMLIAPADDCRVVAYADNILVLGRTREAVEAYFRTLQQRAEGFAGWRLRPRMDAEYVRQLDTDPFTFLHHDGRLVSGRFVWAPDRRKLDHYLTAEDDRVGLSLGEIDRAEASLVHWRRAYPNWPDGDRFELEQLAALAARRFYEQSSPLNRSRAAHALALSFFEHGGVRPLWELTPTGTCGAHEVRRLELLEVAENRVRAIEGRLSARTSAAHTA